MIFTFGFNHVCSCGLSLRACYVEIEGDYFIAREEMAARYGVKWAFQYESQEAAGVEAYGLKRVVASEACGCGGLGREPFEPAGHMSEAQLEELLAKARAERGAPP